MVRAAVAYILSFLTGFYHESIPVRPLMRLLLRTLTSFARLKALLYPPYEKMMRYRAFVRPYAPAVPVPSKALWKLTFGFSTAVCPPKTANPVKTTNSKVPTLTRPTALENQ